MLYVLRRLSLGIGLIALASAILLIADLGRRTAGSPDQQQFRVAIFKFADTPVLDEGIRGTVDALAARGYRDGDRLILEHYNAQGDMPTSATIARQVTSGGYDLIITSSTPVLQAVANNNKETQARHVFTMVADPFSAGVGLNRDKPLEHPPYLVGQGALPASSSAFELARRMNPSLTRIGVAFNPSESNSVAVMVQAREAAKRMGLELLEANVDNTSAVAEAFSSTIARGAEALWIGADNTVVSAVNTVIAVGKRANVPVFSILPGAPDRGTLFDVGPNFYEIGRLGGELAADVLDGADMTAIPIRDVLSLAPSFISIDVNALEGLRGWTVPDDLRAEASVLVDGTGTHRKGEDSAAANRPLSKQWNIGMVQLVRVAEVEEEEASVMAGLKEAGLEEGRAFTRTVRDAQGDMAALGSVLDAPEVGDAALALVVAGVEAICQLPGNLTTSAFPAIATAAEQGRVPFFGFQSTQPKFGALAVMARDYYDNGREAGLLATRVMRGESPDRIPFVPVRSAKLIVNLDAARRLNLVTPPELVAKADTVVGR